MKLARAQFDLAVRTCEAFGMKRLVQRVDTLAHDSGLALVAGGCKVELKVAFAVQFALLFDEAARLQVDPTRRIGAHKVVRAKDLADGAYEGPADQLGARVACGQVVRVGLVEQVTAQGAAVAADNAVT